jgi:death-on-curing protein
VGEAELAPPTPLEDCQRDTIESALAAPAARFAGVEAYHDLPSKGAALTYALAKSQACIDGNKRVAFILLLEFLSINGATLDDAGDESAADMILRTAGSAAQHRDMVRLELCEWLMRHIIDGEGFE